MASYRIDDLDRRILSMLIRDARMPMTEISRECGISTAAIHQRIKKLEETNVISGTKLTVRPSALGFDVCAFIMVSLTEGSRYQDVVTALEHIPEVVECHFVTGKASLMLKVYCHDNGHLMKVLVNTIQKIPYIQSTDTIISLDDPIERQIGIK